jgi:hypothetical protein
MEQENIDNNMIQGFPKDIEKPEAPKKWHTQQEKVLKEWGEAAACYRYMNYQAFLMFQKLSMRFTLPVIVLSTVTGTANFAQEQFPISIRSSVPSIIGGLNLIAGIIATIMQFLKINELMESHRSASQLYGKLSRRIRLELNLPLVNRTLDGSDMVHDCHQEMDRLIEQSPPIPRKVLSDFEREFPDDKIFTKPEILHVHPILPFKAIKEYSIMSLLKDPKQRNLTEDQLKDELDELRGRVMPGNKKIPDDPLKASGIRRRPAPTGDSILKMTDTPPKKITQEPDIETGEVEYTDEEVVEEE